ncbi:MAG: helix-turn-helix domain-containing protein [Candidatus Puniceispirillales bacterium WSBS_2018_MAG_OTU23]
MTADDKILNNQNLNPHSDSPPYIESLGDAVAFHLNRFFKSHDGALPASGLYQAVLEEVERPLLIATLNACGGNQLRAAEVLGLNRNTLRKKILKLGLSPPALQMKRLKNAK